MQLPLIIRETLFGEDVYAERSGLISTDSLHQKISSSRMIRKTDFPRKHNQGGIYHQFTMQLWRVQ